MTKKTVLITGANRGIGRETARQLGKLNYTVWLGCRDEERGLQAESELRSEGIDAHFVQLDITDEASVNKAVDEIEARAAHLDVLVNNVGIGAGLAEPPSTESLTQIQDMLNTNVIGTIRVTQTFLPLIRRSAGGRIVMISSGLGSLDLTSDLRSPTWGLTASGYSLSKAALNMYTLKLAKELLADGIKVNAACPGSVATESTGPFAPRTVEQGAQIAVRLATLDWMGPTGGFYHDGEGPGIAPYGW